MSNCHFCKFVSGEQTVAAKIYEDDIVIVMDDDRPHDPSQPMHLIIVAKGHIANNASALTPEAKNIVVHMYEVAHALALKMGLSDGINFRVSAAKDISKRKSHLHGHIFGEDPLDPKFIIKS